MSELPSGTVTFLFTDLEGSTALLKHLGRDRYDELLAEHGRLLRAAFAAHDGRVVDTQGDSFFVAFRTAAEAVAAAVGAQRDLAARRWPEDVVVKVRMGLHTGEPKVGEERYVGIGVHRAARIGAAGHGGQILLSSATKEVGRGGSAGRDHDQGPRHPAPEGHRPTPARLPAGRRGPAEQVRRPEDARRGAEAQEAAHVRRLGARRRDRGRRGHPDLRPGTERSERRNRRRGQCRRNHRSTLESRHGQCAGRRRPRRRRLRSRQSLGLQPRRRDRLARRPGYGEGGARDSHGRWRQRTRRRTRRRLGGERRSRQGAWRPQAHRSAL